MRTPERPEERVGLIILAAGAGRRMRSSLPKPLHTVAGVPMIERVLRAGAGAQPDRTVVVVGLETADLSTHLQQRFDVQTVVQDPPLGTGDAVRLALAALPDAERAVVLFSDHPLLEPRTVADLLLGAQTNGARVTLLTVNLPDARAFGRVVRGDDGHVIGIVEQRDDDPTQRLGPAEIYSGLMAFDAAWARCALDRIAPSGATNELYLTELVAIAVTEHRPGEPWPVASVTGGPDAAVGVNDRLDLAWAEARAWARKREQLMRAGVTMRLPETITIDEDVDVGPDTILLPHSSLAGATTVGTGCTIGPASVIHDSRLGDRVTVRSSTVEDSEIADDTDVGPYAHLRAGTAIGPHVHIGNFAELKNARLAAGVKVGHFSYIGDAAIGADTNIGAGTVTANFDGERKHQTEIGARAFIGSDSVLRAPLRIGDDARTGAGSVVTRDVPAGATVVGIPARVVRRSPQDRSPVAEEG